MPQRQARRRAEQDFMMPFLYAYSQVTYMLENPFFKLVKKGIVPLETS